jgi:hypothetical protein
MGGRSLGWGGTAPGSTANDVAVEEDAEDQGKGDPASGGTEDEAKIDWSKISARTYGRGNVTYVLLAPGKVTTA